MTETDARLLEVRQWLAHLDLPGLQPASLRPASADASFRRYFRIDAQAGSFIIMDAPPAQEDVAPFIHAATVLAQAGVAVPTIHAADTKRGFLLLTDFGSTTMLARLNAQPESAKALYAAASEQLVRLQSGSQTGVFPAYDRQRLMTELRLFDQWYLARHRNYPLSDQQHQALDGVYEALLGNNLAQPAVFVHRDWHSRNLMVLESPTGDLTGLGVIDFQDALYGPVTYDLVSLLRDAYVQWSEEQVIDWAVRHWQAARSAGIAVHPDFGDFYRDFEWMGLQRHLKVLGIFARLAIRDNKPAYLEDMPRVLHYVVQTAARYREFAPLFALLQAIEGRPLRSALTF